MYTSPSFYIQLPFYVGEKSIPYFIELMWFCYSRRNFQEHKFQCIQSIVLLNEVAQISMSSCSEFRAAEP